MYIKKCLSKLYCRLSPKHCPASLYGSGRVLMFQYVARLYLIARPSVRWFLSPRKTVCMFYCCYSLSLQHITTQRAESEFRTSSQKAFCIFLFSHVQTYIQPCGDLLRCSRTASVNRETEAVVAEMSEQVWTIHYEPCIVAPWWLTVASLNRTSLKFLTSAVLKVPFSFIVTEIEAIKI